MKLPESRIALSFMAHPDDAEILCAGTLIRLAEAGWEIHIATAAPGDCGTTTETRWAISARRTVEATQAAALIGAQYHCLDERDGFIVYDKPAIQKTVDLFRRVAPSLVFTHAPKDYMLDHEQASLLARMGTFLYGAPNASAFPVRPGSCIPYLYYCDPMEGIDALGNPVQPTTWVEVTAQLQRKTEMLATHASQRQWLLAHHGIDEYLDSMRRHVALRGRDVGVPAAEAFVQHRGHAYPREDLLATLFGPASK
jgi:LmbE family N-acetylglucosaminyl deacetylase